jgi:hypothetical protein
MKLRQDEYAALVFRLQSYGKCRNETDSNLSKMIQISVGNPETACNAAKERKCMYEAGNTRSPGMQCPFHHGTQTEKRQYTYTFPSARKILRRRFVHNIKMCIFVIAKT